MTDESGIRVGSPSVVATELPTPLVYARGRFNFPRRAGSRSRAQGRCGRAVRIRAAGAHARGLRPSDEGPNDRVGLSAGQTYPDGLVGQSDPAYAHAHERLVAYLSS